MSGKDARRAKLRKVPLEITVLVPSWERHRYEGLREIAIVNAETGRTEYMQNVRVRPVWPKEDV